MLSNNWRDYNRGDRDPPSGPLNRPLRTCTDNNGSEHMPEAELKLDIGPHILPALQGPPVQDINQETRDGQRRHCQSSGPFILPHYAFLPFLHQILHGQCFGVFAVPESQKSSTIQKEKCLIGSGLHFPMRLFCERCVFRSLHGSHWNSVLERRCLLFSCCVDDFLNTFKAKLSEMLERHFLVLGLLWCNKVKISLWGKKITLNNSTAVTRGCSLLANGQRQSWSIYDKTAACTYNKQLLSIVDANIQ